MKGNFFASPTEESLVKINIVTKYFAAWAQIISKFKNKIRYIDLFCGPGIYEDGTKSTPLIVLENAINSPKICTSLISIFNDKTTDFTDVLRDEIESMPKISRLTHKPIITNIEICENNIGQLTSVKHIPTLLFADPWGYKGLTMELFASFLKEKYSEAIFFFNYQFINAYFESNPVEEHFGSIIGSNKIEELKSVLPGLSPRERNDVIMDSLKSAFQIEEKNTNKNGMCSPSRLRVNMAEDQLTILST